MTGRVNINITGDVYLGRRIEPIAIKDPYLLFGKKVVELFSASDFNILNLESPLTHAGEKDMLNKTGPNLKASPETIGALSVLRTDLVTLANNHIYDYSEKGLSDTLSLCESNGIETVGAGQTLAEASEIFLKEIKGVKLAVVNIAENEWCNASETRGGGNPMNIIANVKALNKARELAEIVILIIHGGHELYYYPSPRMVEQYRFYAEQGASIIVGHHSHCISGFEVYNAVPIFYGLGNFLFDADILFEGWFRGIVLNIQIDQDKKMKWELFPCSQDKIDLKVTLLDGAEKIELENQIKKINEVIADDQKLEEMFCTFVESIKKGVLMDFSTLNLFDNRYVWSAANRLRLGRIFLKRKQLKSILNYLRCEAHHDVSSKILLDYINLK